MHNTLDRLVTIASLSMRLGEVERATRHPDGRTPETDTTHTVMLALSVVALADEFGLDPGKMAMLALVHDLVEAEAGDVNTMIPLSTDQQAQKDRREAEALQRLQHALAGSPRLVNLLDEYEAQESKEARTVKVLDKVMPKLTHTLSDFKAVREIDFKALGVYGLSREFLGDLHNAQVKKFATLHPDLPEVIGILRAACDLSEDRWDRLEEEARSR